MNKENKELLEELVITTVLIIFCVIASMYAVIPE